MAQFSMDGVDALQLSLEAVANIPDDVAADMLNAEADVAISYQKKSIDEKHLSPHGVLRESIKAKQGKSKSGKPYVDIYPQGTHHTNPGGTKVRNADIGFINEFGAAKKSIPAAQWMRTANEKAGNDVEAAGFKVYDEFLQKNNL